MIRMSDQISELTAAFTKAQAAFPAVPRGGSNPHLQSRYSTLTDLIEAIREPLATNNLAFTQCLGMEGDMTVLTTMLMHASGQFISSQMPVQAMEPNRGTNEMQALGSTIQYLRRYALAAMSGVASAEEDDDGNKSGWSRSRKETQKAGTKRSAPEELKAPIPAASGVADISDYTGVKTLTGMLVSNLAPQYLLPLLARYAEDMKKEKDKDKIEAMSLAARAANYRWAHILEEDLSPEHRAGLIEYLDGFNSLGEYAQRVLDTLKGKEE